MTTHGEQWRDKAAKKIMGYCLTRGWAWTQPIEIATANPMSRQTQYSIEVDDCTGHKVELVYITNGGEPKFLDEYGRAVELNVENFDSFTAELVKRQRPSKRQMSLPI